MKPVYTRLDLLEDALAVAFMLALFPIAWVIAYGFGGPL